MHIEVFPDKDSYIDPNGKLVATSWYWHFKAKNGKVTADSEAFPTKAHAIRAAKAVVRAVMNCPSGGLTVQFTQHESEGCLVIKWSAY